MLWCSFCVYEAEFTASCRVGECMIEKMARNSHSKFAYRIRHKICYHRLFNENDTSHDFAQNIRLVASSRLCKFASRLTARWSKLSTVTGLFSSFLSATYWLEQCPLGFLFAYRLSTPSLLIEKEEEEQAKKISAATQQEH